MCVGILSDAYSEFYEIIRLMSEVFLFFYGFEDTVMYINSRVYY